MSDLVTRRVLYKSKEWSRLVYAGWTTVSVEDRESANPIAVMALEPRISLRNNQKNKELLRDAHIEGLKQVIVDLLLSADSAWEEREDGHDWKEACERARAAIK